MPINAALLLIDLQNDFCSGGKLAVQGGNEVMAIANRLQPRFAHVVASQDWHPADHASFADNHPNQVVGNVIDIEGIKQILWPAHCVADTQGAAFHPDLNVQGIHKIFQKGTHKTIDSYSAFFDNDHRHATGLHEYLASLNINTIYVMGLATDYCVKYSVLDALNAGFAVHLVLDGCKGVELQNGDINKAIDEMKAAGAIIVLSKELL